MGGGIVSLKTHQTKRAAPTTTAELKELRARLRAKMAELRALVSANKKAGRKAAFQFSPAWGNGLLARSPFNNV